MALFLVLARVELAREGASRATFDDSLILPLASLLALFNLGYLTSYLFAYERWADGYREIVAQIPRGARVLPVYTNGREGTVAPLLHMGSYVVMDRGALTPYLFSGDGGHPMKYFRFKERLYAPKQRWYDADVPFVIPGSAIACNYDFLLVDRPFELRKLAVSGPTVAQNDSAVLMAIDFPEFWLRSTGESSASGHAPFLQLPLNLAPRRATHARTRLNLRVEELKMKRVRTSQRPRTTILRWGALAVLAAAGAPAMAQDCPAGQNPTASYAPTGVVRNVTVPGWAGGMSSGIRIQPGFLYKMTAVGSIKVGVFGETGTPPDGWVPQGQCGPGCPSETAYTFALLYRVGSGGAWQLLGSGQSAAKLGPRDAAGSELQFGINDTKLSDNDGAHVVTITEFKLGPTTCVKPAPVTQSFFGGWYMASSSKSSPPKSSAPPLPCAGKTPDGRKQSFQFALYCGGLFNRYIPVEACTRAEALPEAQAFARSAPPNCVLAP